MNDKEKLVAYCLLRIHRYSIEETKKIMSEIDKKMTEHMEGEK